MAHLLMLILPFEILKPSKPLSCSFARYALAILWTLTSFLDHSVWIFLLPLFIFHCKDLKMQCTLWGSVHFGINFQLLNFFYPGKLFKHVLAFFCNSAVFFETFGLLVSWMTSASLFVSPPINFLRFPAVYFQVSDWVGVKPLLLPFLTSLSLHHSGPWQSKYFQCQETITVHIDFSSQDCFETCDMYWSGGGNSVYVEWFARPQRLRTKACFWPNAVTLAACRRWKCPSALQLVN